MAVGTNPSLTNPLDELLGIPDSPQVPNATNTLENILAKPTKTPSNNPLERLLGSSIEGGLPTPMPLTFDPAGLVLRAISQQETGGRYEAVGGIAIKGRGRAIGKYQFMPQTLIGLGYGKYLKSPIPDDYIDEAKAQDLASPFLSRPEIQDEAAIAHVGNLAKSLGIDLDRLTERDVARLAAAWVGGANMANSPERWPRVKVGPGVVTTVQDYVNKVVANARTISGMEAVPEGFSGGPGFPIRLSGPGLALAGPPQPTGAPPGPSVPLATPGMHPIDVGLLSGLRAVTSSPAFQAIAQGVQGLGMVGGMVKEAIPEQVRKSLGAPFRFGGVVAHTIFKGADALATVALGLPATVLTTFYEPTDAVTTAVLRNRTAQEVLVMRTKPGKPGMKSKGGPFWDKARQLLPNYGRIVEEAWWDNFFGQGLGSLKVGAMIADHVLPPELKRSQAARYTLAFGLAVSADPLNWLTPAKISKASGLTRLAQTLTPKVEEIAYANKAVRTVTTVLSKRYPDMAGGLIDPVMARSSALIYHAEYSGSIRQFEKALDDISRTFGQDPRAQQLVTKYIDAGTPGARKTILALATKEGIKAEDVARIGDSMVGAGEEMGRYLVSKGFISEDEYKQLHGRYLRIVYERYLNPTEFADNLRRMNLPEAWMPKVYENKLRGRLASKALYKRRLLSQSNVNTLMYKVFEQPGRSLDEWLNIVNGLVRKDKNWAKAHYTQKESAVAAVIDLLTEPQLIGKTGKKGFLLVPGVSPKTVVSPQGAVMEAWQVKSTAGRRAMGSAELASRIEGQIGENIQKLPHTRVHGLRRQMRLFTQRKDLPQEIKEALGEITEAGPRFAQQMTVFAKQKAIQETLEYISKNVARTKSQLDLASPNLIGKRRWVPITGTPDTIGPLFRDVEKGEELLHLPWAFENLMNDLRKAPRYARRGYESFEKSWTDYLETATSGFKRLLVTHRPGGTLRNILSTIIMGDMATGGALAADPSILKWAAQEWSGKGQFFQEISRYADLGADSMKIHEMGLVANRVRQAKPGTGWVKSLEDIGRHFWDDPVKLYGFTEGVTRLAVGKKLHDRAVKKLGRALNELEWRTIAEESLNATINYGDVPYFIEKVRRFGLFPITSFITFPWKVTPRVFKTMWESPTTILKYPRAVEAINRGQLGDQGYETLAGVSPEWLRQNMMVYTPNGESFNLGWIMPWQALDEFAKVVSNVSAPTGPRDVNLLSNLFLNWYGELYYNRDFLGRPVVDVNDTRAQAAKKIAVYTSERLGGITDVKHMTESLIEMYNRPPEVKTDRFGEPLPDIGDVVLTFLGFKPYKVEPEAMKKKRLSTIRFEANGFQQAARRKFISYVNDYGNDQKVWPDHIKREWTDYMEQTRRNISRRQLEAQYIQGLPLDSIPQR